MGTRLILPACLMLGALLQGCAAPQPYNYTNLRAHPPRSILVLPPLNESTDVMGPYSYVSTVSHPLGELGYYVFPVAVVDQYLKDNGMPTPGEMHQIPLEKVRDIIGADAVLYTTLTQYGTKYQVVNSVSTVGVRARLIDTQTGGLLWDGQAQVQEATGGSGNAIADLVIAAVTQIINSKKDEAHNVARTANWQLFMTPDRRLLYGPHNPKYKSD